MNLAMTLLVTNLIPTRYSLLSRLQNWDDQDSWKDFSDIVFGPFCRSLEGVP